MLSLTSLLSIIALSSWVVLADTNDQVGADINYGSFQKPSSRVRPRFRYWLPDASVDKATVKANIKSSGEIGAGGVEFLPFFNYGNEIGTYPFGADWSTYGFGTQAFQEIFRAALEAHKENGLIMDFPLGPNQGQGVPAKSDDEGLQWDLVPISESVPLSGAFNGTIPGWGTGDFIALTSALVLSEANFSLPASTFNPSTYDHYSRLIIDHESLTDLRNEVSSSGHASLSLGPAQSGIEYRLFAFYQKRSLNKNLNFPNNRSETIFDNGSYVVDHYSARGAETITRFWEEHILTDGVKELLMEVGNYGWEDSVEILSNISWTPSLPSKFEKKHGYSIYRYLPVIMWYNNNINIQSSSPGQIQCLLNTEDMGEGYINDFRAVLADGYREYLEALTAWTNNYLNLQMSAQVSYNLPMDMEANIPFVNAPECESLQFNSNIDGYRQFSGVANLVGKRIISNELGAEFGKAFQMTFPRLLWHINRAVVGGVNQFVLHGQSYTGNYYETTWPGYTAFSYVVTDNWSDKQPAWYHGFADALDNVARIQYVQQKGTPKVDVALYNKASATDPNFATLYDSEDLQSAGFTYAYLSPENFNLPQAEVDGGILAPDGPSFKAIVITNTQNMTLDAISYLRKYATAGLPVILSGGDPGYFLSANASGKAAVENALTALKKTRNVYSVGEGEVASKLASIGISPNIKVQTNGTWYTTWREDTSEGIDYAFVFSDGVAASGHLQVLSTKIPYIFDTWTGKCRPLLQYTRQYNRTAIPLSLAGNQTVVIAFSSKALQDVDTPNFHASKVPSNIIGYNYTKSEGLTLQMTAPLTTHDNQSLALSTGRSYTPVSNATVPPLFELTNWTLTAEHWEAPTNISDAAIVAVKHNTTHHLSSLTSWADIGALANVSGLGYYTTTFSWPPATSTADGAYITFSNILHAIRLYVNGQSIPPLDYSNAVADIGSYIQEGENEVLAIVPTTMWNYLRSILDQLEMSGSPPLLGSFAASIGGVPGQTDNGLVGPVTVTPYVNWKIGV